MTGPPLEDVFAAGRVRFLVTPHCNIGCVYCHNEGQPKGESPIPIHLVKRVADAVSDKGWKLRSVTFSGGEPLLHPNLSELASAVSAAAESITVVSNGKLLDGPKLEALRDAGVDRLRIGLDSLTRRTSRPTPGEISPVEIIRRVEQAQQAGLTVGINTVVTHFNRAELGGIVAYCAARRLTLKLFEHVEVAANPGAENLKMTARPSVPFEDVHRLVLQELGDCEHGECEILGAANHVYRRRSDDFEVRYCRFLCRFCLCFRTGTRIDARGFVYSCMKARGAIRLQGEEGDALLQALRPVALGQCPSRDVE